MHRNFASRGLSGDARTIYDDDARPVQRRAVPLDKEVNHILDAPGIPRVPAHETRERVLHHNKPVRRRGHEPGALA